MFAYGRSKVQTPHPCRRSEGSVQALHHPVDGRVRPAVTDSSEVQRVRVKARQPDRCGPNHAA
jgi:hypothetical protein